MGMTERALLGVPFALAADLAPTTFSRFDWLVFWL
jgi:hypothetical protein